MEGDAVSATIGVLVQNLINVTKDEISLIRGLHKEAAKLEGTLGMIQSSLDDALKKFIIDEAVKGWLQELEAVVFDADNVLDELNYRLLSKKMAAIRTDKKNKKVASYFPFFNNYIRRRYLALRIRKINLNFESIDKRATKLSLERRLADAPTAPSDATAFETDSCTIDPIFIGRQDDVLEIIEMLTTPKEQALSIIPIVGMGGLGKTTLVRNVFSHKKTKSCFGKHIWVHVSQNFDAVTLLKKILIDLKPEEAEVEINREGIQKKLREALGGKTYLLVLDDVWNQDRQKWEDFINSWSGITSTKGSGILVTTRNIEVGSMVNTLGIHRLNGLSKEQCWSIIKDKAFKGGFVPQGIEAIGRSIATRCQGLPLAANVVGGVLRDKSQDEWLSIQQNWLSDVGLGGDENNISRILRLSYDHLSSPSLKKCFAYCSIFPKGAHIGTEYLIQLWMAEGFLQPSPTSDMENVGNKLVQSSLLHVVDRDEYNNVTRCRMHDLVHDLAASMLGLKVSYNASGDNNQARYILWQNQGDESSSIPKEKTQWLRTLFYKGEIFDIMFSDFKSLHVLNLVGPFEVLPDSIRELIHLRFLSISRTSIGKLPDTIGELYNLQTFKAHNPRLKKLPSTFKYLFNLRHIHMPRSTEFPPQLGMLTSLQTLTYFKVRDVEGHRIEELGSLKNLKGKLKIDNLEEVKWKNESKKACLFQKPGIVRLVLRWEWSNGKKDESVLRGLQPHPNLKFLGIFGYSGAVFPSWTLKMEGLNNLMEIKLESCVECEEIPMMGHLPRLKYLYLSDLENVKSISSSFYNIENCSSNNVFPALERLDLIEMSNLKEWAEVEISSGAQVKIFPCLQYLKIKKCKQLRSAPSQFPCLKVVEIEGMDSGIPLANICGIKLTSLVKLKISKVREMVRLPDWLYHNNQNLSTFDIRTCYELRGLPKGLQTLNSLEELTISDCNRLKSIPFSSGQHSHGLASLRRLSIGNNTGIHLPCEMVESCASSLEEFHLWGSVSDMPTIIGCMHKMHRLVVLDMTSVPKFMISSPTEHGSYRNLNTLSFSPDESWDYVSFNKVVGGILRFGCLSLQKLELAGDDDWRSLPDQLQHLTALSELKLYKFGIRELPEWFGKLSSLEELCLQRCRNLKRMPFVELMQRLTKLTYLRINECPLLEKRGTGPEIDVPNIWIGGRKLR